MHEHPEGFEGRDYRQDVTQAMPPALQDRDEQLPERSGRSRSPRIVIARILEMLSRIVRWVGLVFALILALHVVFVLGEANSDNGIVSFVASASHSLALGFKDLFLWDDPKLVTLVNYTVAAIFWLIVSAIVTRIIQGIRALGGMN